MKKILVLSHEATLTGAPIFLLKLIKYLNQHSEYEFLIFFKKSGSLLNEFKSQGKILSLENLNSNKNIITRVLIRILPLYRLKRQFYKMKIKLFNPDLIISNTIVNSDLVEVINIKNIKLITIVHEMKGVINQFDQLKINNSKEIISKTSHFISVSAAVKKDLVDEFKIKEEKIDVIHNNISIGSKKITPSVEADKWKKSLNIPSESFIVGSCGSLIWRKGPDIFINIFKQLKNNFRIENIYFIWLGGNQNTSWFIDLENEINNLGFKGKIKILPEVKNTTNFYNAIDIYISTAREEPFGLTIIEAGIHSKPCLAFTGSGGPESILSNDVGILIPYGDTKAAAEEIIKLKENQEILNKYSKSINDLVIKIARQDNNLKYKEIIDSFMP